MLSPFPLVRVPVAQALLGLREDQVTELCEDGLLVAWNIGGGTYRREVRILYPSIAWYGALQNTFPADPATIPDSLFPPDAPVTSVTLQRIFGCGSSHICDLIRAKAFCMAPGAVLRRGVGGEAAVDRLSVIAFLKKRLI